MSNKLESIISLSLALSLGSCCFAGLGTCVDTKNKADTHIFPSILGFSAEGLIPTSMAIDPETGYMFVGSLNNSAPLIIQPSPSSRRVLKKYASIWINDNQKGRLREAYVGNNSDNLFNIRDMLFDEARRKLWVCNSQLPGAAATDPQTNSIISYDVDSEDNISLDHAWILPTDPSTRTSPKNDTCGRLAILYGGTIIASNYNLPATAPEKAVAIYAVSPGNPYSIPKPWVTYQSISADLATTTDKDIGIEGIYADRNKIRVISRLKANKSYDLTYSDDRFISSRFVNVYYDNDVDSAKIHPVDLIYDSTNDREYFLVSTMKKITDTDGSDAVNCYLMSSKKLVSANAWKAKGINSIPGSKGTRCFGLGIFKGVGYIISSLHKDAGNVSITKITLQK